MASTQNNKWNVIHYKLWRCIISYDAYIFECNVFMISLIAAWKEKNVIFVF